MLILEQTDNEKIDLLRDAINNKFEISFWYRGQDFQQKKREGETAKQGWRFGQPVNLGKSKASNQWMIRVFQTKGTTNSVTTTYRTGNTKGGKPHWKTFLVDEMDNITILNGENGASNSPFEPESKYRKDGSDRHMSSVDTYYDASTPEPTPEPTPRPTRQATPQAPPPIQKPVQPTLSTLKPTDVEAKPEEEPELEPKKITENKSNGFLKWILNLNHGSNR